MAHYFLSDTCKRRQYALVVERGIRVDEIREVVFACILHQGRKAAGRRYRAMGWAVEDQEYLRTESFKLGWEPR